MRRIILNRKKLKFYTVTKEYMLYLKKYDEKIMDNTGTKNKRPYRSNYN